MELHHQSIKNLNVKLFLRRYLVLYFVYCI